MTDNDKLTRWQTGLDQAYDSALDAGDREALEREMVEDSILSDEEKLTEMAVLFFKTHLDECLPWAVDELMPAHTKAWMTEKELSDLQAGERDCRERPTNKEYWNWDDDRI